MEGKTVVVVDKLGMSEKQAQGGRLAKKVVKVSKAGE